MRLFCSLALFCTPALASFDNKKNSSDNALNETKLGSPKPRQMTYGLNPKEPKHRPQKEDNDDRLATKYSEEWNLKTPKPLPKPRNLKPVKFIENSTIQEITIDPPFENQPIIRENTISSLSVGDHELSNEYLKLDQSPHNTHERAIVGHHSLESPNSDDDDSLDQLPVPEMIPRPPTPRQRKIAMCIFAVGGLLLVGLCKPLITPLITTLVRYFTRPPPPSIQPLVSTSAPTMCENVYFPPNWETISSKSNPVGVCQEVMTKVQKSCVRLDDYETIVRCSNLIGKTTSLGEVLTNPSTSQQVGQCYEILQKTKYACGSGSGIDQSCQVFNECQQLLLNNNIPHDIVDNLNNLDMSVCKSSPGEWPICPNKSTVPIPPKNPICPMPPPPTPVDSTTLTNPIGTKVSTNVVEKLAKSETPCYGPTTVCYANQKLQKIVCETIFDNCHRTN